MKLRSVSTVVLAVLTGSLALAQEKRPVTFEDVLALKTVASPVMAPDGGSILYTVTGWEAGDEEGAMDSVGHLWRVSVADGAATQLTFGDKGESSPRWSPDGRFISFLAARGDDDEPKSQIWLMRATGGEATQLTDAKEGVSSYAWSPDGGRIAFVTKDALSEEQEVKKKRRDDSVVYEGDVRMQHLWVIDVTTKEATQRTEGTDFTVKGESSWASDGNRIAFAAAPTLLLRDDRDDVYILTLDGDVVKKITDGPGSDDSPAWSPDGGHIAYLSTPNDNEPLPDGTLIRPLVNARLMLYDVATEDHRDVSGGFDLIPSNPVWTPDGERILLSVGDRAYREVYAYDLAGERYEKLTEKTFTTDVSHDADGSRVAFVRESGSAPADVYVAAPDFSDPTRLTNVHPELTELALGSTEVVTWKSSDGLEVEGVLLKPVGYREGERYPLMVVAHGGPAAAHHDYFRVRYGDGGQHWAGRGWAVLYPNPRGSTNYGEDFMRANLADWGEGDYRDIMTGVDAMIDRGIADPDKLAFQGWSYGGYMTCWTISQTTRFKAAMIGAGLTNLVSMYGTNDIPNYLATFFNGTLSQETEHLYRERSGLTHVDRVTTPTLILHGANDERVPIGQALELFRALKDRGVPTELVFYPREGHSLREYYHRLDRLNRQYDWITRHTLGTGHTMN